jgi:hypothetical protein
VEIKKDDSVQSEEILFDIKNTPPYNRHFIILCVYHKGEHI